MMNSCGECGKTCATNHGLRVHIGRKHPKSWICRTCGKYFGNTPFAVDDGRQFRAWMNCQYRHDHDGKNCFAPEMMAGEMKPGDPCKGCTFKDSNRCKKFNMYRFDTRNFPKLPCDGYDDSEATEGDVT